MQKLKDPKRERSDANPLSIFGPIGLVIVIIAAILGVFVLVKYFSPLQYHIQIDTSPQEAEVLLLNREPLKTPCDFYIKTSDKVLNFVVKKEGYETVGKSILLENKDTVLNYKLNEIKPEETLSIPITQINEGLLSPAVNKIVESSNGELYLLLENGIVFSKNNNGFTILYRGTPTDFAITPYGTFVVEGSSKLILLSSKGESNIEPTPFSLAQSLCYDEKSNTLFIGCQSGLYTYKPDNRQFAQLYKNIVNITRLYLSDRNLYVCTNEYQKEPYLMNLYCYNTETSRLSTIKKKINSAFTGVNKLFIAMQKGNDVEVLSSAEDSIRFTSAGLIKDIIPNSPNLYVSNDKIYFSDVNSGLYINEGGEFKKISAFPYITSLGEYENKLIAGTMRNGLIENPLTSNSKSIPIGVLTPPLYFIHSQDILVSLRGEGVYQFDKGKWTNILSFKNTSTGTLEQAFSETEFQGKRFIGTDKCVYEISNNISKVCPPNYSGISRNFLQSISNNLYDFSESGIYCFNENFWEKVISNIPIDTVSGQEIKIRNIIFQNNTIYLLTESNGVMVSIDDGKTFDTLKETEGKYISAMCISLQGTFIAADNGLYLIKDKQEMNTLPYTIGFITSIASIDDSIYFGSSKGLFQYKNGVYYHIDKEAILSVVSMKLVDNNILISTRDSVYKLELQMH